MNQELQTKPNILRRVIAAIIDYSIVIGFTFSYLYIFGEPNGEGGYVINGLPALVPVLFWAIITIGLEQWNGASFGNSIVRLTPISIKNNNQNLTFSQSLKRNLISPVDMLFFGLIGIITIKNTDKNQRLGDIWANTIVVKNDD